MRNGVALLLALTCLAGCAATGPAFQSAPPPKPDEALVYVYWTETRAFSLRTAYLTLDGQPAAELSHKGYTTLRVSPGQHRLVQTFGSWGVPESSQVTSEKPLELDLRPGETTFVEFYTEGEIVPTVTSSRVGMILHRGLQTVPQADGLRRIADCSYQPAKTEKR